LVDSWFQSLFCCQSIVASTVSLWIPIKNVSEV
jgi:hypothetical protein